jgi:hypothetical protein
MWIGTLGVVRGEKALILADHRGRFGEGVSR